MIDAKRQSRPVQFETVQDFSDRWRKKLRTLHADVFALEQAVELISEGYFDRHEVLFSDAREPLTSARESAELLIAGYNCFAEDNGSLSAWTGLTAQVHAEKISILLSVRPTGSLLLNDFRFG